MQNPFRFERDKHTKRFCKEFKIKNLDEYHDSYVQSDALISADVFDNFQNMCLKIYKLDPSIFFQLRISMTSSL